MAYKTFVAGEEALAADVNSYLMSQTVARFASAAARTSAIASPVLNQLTTLDTRPGMVQYWNGSAWLDVQLEIKTGQFVGTTNAAGDASVTYPSAFGAGIQYTLTTGNMNWNMVVAVMTQTSAGFTARCFTSSVLANIAVQFTWLSIGPRA